MNENPLVSICVISYNSAKTILETLESAKNQTYQNIELIISDDCSKDDTLDIVRKWVDKNGKRFTRVQIITIQENSGVPANCNRAVKASNGCWFKLIAADDILLPDCIETYIEYVKENPDSEFIVSRLKLFGNEKEIEKIREKLSYDYFKVSNSDLKYLIGIRNFLLAPSAFYRRQSFEEIDRFEEAIPLIEDWPFWIKVYFNNKGVTFLDKELVKYRVESTSLSVGEKSKRFQDSYRTVYEFASINAKNFSKQLWIYLFMLKVSLNFTGICGKAIRGLRFLLPVNYKIKRIVRKYNLPF